MSTIAKTLLAAAATLGLGFAAGPAAAYEGPSFDCQSAHHAAEKVVCRNSGLARVDRNLDLTYRRLRDEVGFYESLKVRNEERAFIKERNACGDDYTCVRVTYRGQMQSLRGRLKQLGIALHYE